MLLKNKSREIRCIIHFLFAFLVYENVINRGSIFGSINIDDLGVGIAFLFLCSIFSFALLSANIRSINYIKMFFSVLAATMIYTLTRYIIYWTYYKLWLIFIEDMTAVKEAILWAADSLFFVLIVFICAVLVYSLLNFLFKNSMPKPFPCKRAVILMSLAAAVLRLLGNICIPTIPSSFIVGEFGTRTGYHYMNLIMYSLDAVMISMMFIVVFFSHIHMDGCKELQAEISNE